MTELFFCFLLLIHPFAVWELCPDAGLSYDDDDGDGEGRVCGHVVEMVFLDQGAVINAICYVFEGSSELGMFTEM